MEETKEMHKINEYKNKIELEKLERDKQMKDVKKLKKNDIK